MSGSPVFVDGRLVGAVAYAFPFGKEPIAGITPIAEMIEATRSPRATRGLDPAAPRRRRFAWRRRSTARRWRPPCAGRCARSVPAPSAGSRCPPGLAGASLSPLALPLVFSGFDADTFDWARGVFSAMGFAPVMGGGGGDSGPGPLPDLSPGAAVGVSLVEGDLDLSVTGTITHIDGDRVYAFGHPFYNLGPTQFPMKKAWVYSVFPSLQVVLEDRRRAPTRSAPWTRTGRPRSPAASAKPPRMIPVEVRLRSAARERADLPLPHGRGRAVHAPARPTCRCSRCSRATSGPSAPRPCASRAASPSPAGARSACEDVVADDQPAPQAAAAAGRRRSRSSSATTSRRCAIEKLDVTVDAEETLRGRDAGAGVGRARRSRCGRAPWRRCRCSCAPTAARRSTQTLPVAIPASAPAGSYTLLVADAADDGRSRAARDCARRFAPRDLDQLLRALNGLRAGNRIYARLTRPGGGAVVGGEYLPALPGSVLSVLGSSDQGTGVVVPLRPVHGVEPASSPPITPSPAGGSSRISVER